MKKKSLKNKSGKRVKLRTKLAKSNAGNNKLRIKHLVSFLFLKVREFALIGILSFVLLTLFSIYSYPKFDLAGQYLSDLGVGSTGAFFNSGIMVCALFLLPLFISFYKPHAFFRQVASFIGIAAMIFFAGIAFFPASMGVIHTSLAGLFFFCTMITILFVGFDYAKNILRKEKRGFIFVASFVVLSLLVSSIIIYFLFERTPFWQKLSVIGAIFWVLIFTFSLKR